MFFRLTLSAVLALSSVLSFAQRYLPDFPDENAQKLFDRAEKAYVAGNFERSAKVYANLMEEHGDSYELEFNRLTALVHTTDTTAIAASFQKLLGSPFCDCNFLAIVDDFKQIRYRPIFEMWRKAVQDCQEKEQRILLEKPVKLPEIRTQLLWMKVQDVASDVKVAHKIRYGGHPEISYDSLRTFRAKIYEDQFKQLLNFVSDYGWLGRSLVGEDGAEAAWLIAQHGTYAPIEQVKLLPKILSAATIGEAKMTHYAHLFDLVCSHHRRPQRYGTLRWENPETGQWEIYPLEDEAQVNSFREEAGLPPLEGY